MIYYTAFLFLSKDFTLIYPWGQKPNHVKQNKYNALVP